MKDERDMLFTPEVLIEHPRRSIGVPNAAGTLVLYDISAYNIKAQCQTKRVELLELDNLRSFLFSSDQSESSHQWLGSTEHVLYLRNSSEGETTLWTRQASNAKRENLVGTIPASLAELKTASLANGSIAMTFTAPVNTDGHIQTCLKQLQDSGPMQYETPIIRTWNKWQSSQRLSVFYTQLTLDQHGCWKLSGDITDILHLSQVVYPHSYGAIQGELGSYALGSRGVLISTIKHGRNPSVDISKTMFFVKLKHDLQTQFLISEIKVPGYFGSADSPVFSPDGSLGSFLVCRGVTGRAFLETGIAIIDCTTSAEEDLITAKVASFSKNNQTGWDRQPYDILWSYDSKSLYAYADDLGTSALFRVDVSVPKSILDEFSIIKDPVRITDFRSIQSAATVGRSLDKLFVCCSSTTESSVYGLLDTKTKVLEIIESDSYRNSSLGLAEVMFESVFFPGSHETKVQALIVNPSFLDQSKKYPVLLILHGGPQSASNNAWSTRWNYAAFAEQGFIVVAPNFTGSTGFGLDFTAAVDGDFGGRPYQDIEALHSWITSNLPYADKNQVFAAGGSYGGFMVNWLVGQPLGKKLKAVVSHNGIFSFPSMMASDFVAGWKDAMQGTLWDDPSKWEHWSPYRNAGSWTTPMLVIHSEKDFRVPISQGLSVYNLCKAKGVESRFLYFPEEAHWVLNHKSSLEWYRAVIGWLKEHVEGNDSM